MSQQTIDEGMRAKRAERHIIDPIGKTNQVERRTLHLIKAQFHGIHSSADHPGTVFGALLLKHCRHTARKHRIRHRLPQAAGVTVHQVRVDIDGQGSQTGGQCLPALAGTHLIQQRRRVVLLRAQGNNIGRQQRACFFAALLIGQRLTFRRGFAWLLHPLLVRTSNGRLDLLYRLARRHASSKQLALSVGVADFSASDQLSHSQRLPVERLVPAPHRRADNRLTGTRQRSLAIAAGLCGADHGGHHLWLMFGLGDPPQQDGWRLRQICQLGDGIAVQYLIGFDVDQLIAGLHIHARQPICVVDALLQAGKVYPSRQAEQPVIRTVRLAIGEHPVLVRGGIARKPQHRQQNLRGRCFGNLVSIQIQQDHAIQANTKLNVIRAHHVGRVALLVAVGFRVAVALVWNDSVAVGLDVGSLGLQRGTHFSPPNKRRTANL
ncbi:hypothetical protein [Aeromonas encheleia]|uniref:hypothetical protein n=1 Tax=Aeromonas encheleia TaxID=73010 RepID=UPI003F7C1221